MLARVVESIYWMARYLERAEDMARLINVNANLIMDLPKGVSLGWEPIIDITGTKETYLETHSDFEERVVLKYLIGARSSSISILANLEAAKENARTIRDVIPREVWEEINSLHLYAKENLNAGLSKRGRFNYLEEIITFNQRITGLLAGSMNQDAGYLFLKLGRNLERADMTTRFIDVRTQNLFDQSSLELDIDLKPYRNIQWMSILRSLTGYQMYRREMQVSIGHNKVLWFLFKSKIFPRSVYCCIDEVARCIRKLPNHQKAYEEVLSLKHILNETDLVKQDHSELHQFIDKIQLQTGQIHNALNRRYFLSGMIEVQEEAADQ